MKKYIGAIWNIYDSHFGCEASEVHVNKYWEEEEAEAPPISVCIFKKEDTGLQYDVAITAGMSWKPMNFGENYNGERWSTELIQYFHSIEEEDIDWLLWLSSLPYWDNFALGYGHSVSYTKPLYENSMLSNFLFLNTLIKNDQEIFADFEVAPYPVDLLWVVPITSAEYDLKLKEGLDPIFDLFDSHKHPILLDKLRNSYVENA